MNKITLAMISGLFALSLFGCVGSGALDTPEVKTTKQFQFDGVNFKFNQLHTPTIAYHTPEELKKLLNDKIKSLLEDKGLLSNQETMNKLNITASYQRRFVGDATPLPTDSLSPPRYAYKIEVSNGSKVIKTVEQENLIFKGGIAMNFKILAGALRDKKYELDFIDALAIGIAEEVEGLKSN